jgi:hypothetical protein
MSLTAVHLILVPADSVKEIHTSRIFIRITNNFSDIDLLQRQSELLTTLSLLLCFPRLGAGYLDRTPRSHVAVCPPCTEELLPFGSSFHFHHLTSTHSQSWNSGTLAADSGVAKTSIHVSCFLAFSSPNHAHSTLSSPASPSILERADPNSDTTVSRRLSVSLKNIDSVYCQL